MSKRIWLRGCALTVAMGAFGCGGSVAVDASASASTGSESRSDEDRPTSAPADTGSTGGASIASTGGGVASEPTIPEVPNPDARYLFAVGQPTAEDGSVTPDHVALVRDHLVSSLRAQPDVEVLDPRHPRDELARRSTARGIPSVFVECSLVHHDVDARGTHAAVQVVVVDARTEDVLGTLQGRATAPGPTSPDAEELAFEGAIDSALRGLPRMLSTIH